MNLSLNFKENYLKGDIQLKLLRKNNKDSAKLEVITKQFQDEVMIMRNQNGNELTLKTNKEPKTHLIKIQEVKSSLIFLLTRNIKDNGLHIHFIRLLSEGMCNDIKYLLEMENDTLETLFRFQNSIEDLKLIMNTMKKAEKEVSLYFKDEISFIDNYLTNSI